MSSLGTWWKVATAAAATNKHEVIIEHLDDDKDHEVWSCVSCEWRADGTAAECEALIDMHEAESMLAGAYPYLLEHAKEEGYGFAVDSWMTAAVGDVWNIEIENSGQENTVETCVVVSKSDAHGNLAPAFARANDVALFLDDSSIIAGRRLL